MDIRLTWTQLKTVFDTDHFSMQYTEKETTSVGTIYTIWIVEPEVVRFCQINDTDNASDVSDFEASYKSAANKRISVRNVISDGINHDLVAEVTTGSELRVTSSDRLSQTKTKVNIYNTSSIGPGATVTLSTYTVPGGKVFNLTSGYLGGEESAEFAFNVNGSDIAKFRNSGSNRTRDVLFTEPPEATGSQIININTKNISSKTKTFETTLSGYIIDA